MRKMTRKRGWSLSCTIVLLLIATIAAAGPRQLQLKERDADKAVALQPDTVAVIELDSQPSTGHGWRTPNDVDSRLKIVGREFEASSSGLIGGWVKEKIYVVAAGQGQADLRLEYRRAFESKASGELKFSFTTAGRFTETFTLPESTVQESDDTVRDSSVNDDDTTLPSAFNWCDNNGCTPVKNQGNCGSCWAFATVGPLESLIQINDGITQDLSEQYLVSCNDEGWGCDGGYWAHDYLQSTKVDGETEAGAVLEDHFPYEAQDITCNPPHDKAYRIDSWGYVCPGCTPTIAQLKQALYEHGPLSVTVCVNADFQNYSGGVFSGTSCSTLNHGVVLVGWNDDDGCWIMRNSWGSSWGENGYMRIGYGVSGIGSDAVYVSYNDSPNPDPDPDPDPEPSPDPEDQEIEDGQTISDLSAESGDWLYFFINVPENVSNLNVRISGGSGDADLHTLLGARPTSSEYDCQPYQYGNNEECNHENPQAGTWYIGIQAYRDFSGVSLSATYTDDDSDSVTTCITTDNLDHVDQGRAYRCGFWSACAVGSRDYLGWLQDSVVSSLQEVSADYWEKTDSCQ
ncbi:peptidase C1A [Desulfosarcina variabilis str. Montpellier]